MADPVDEAALVAIHGETLRAVAAQAIRHGLDTGTALQVDSSAYPEALRAVGAAFVTLEKDGDLRGCVGSILPSEPLVANVANNAYAAAFHDTRFAPLTPAEWPSLTVGISVLGALVPIPVRDTAELLRALKPRVDGLVLREGHRRAVFLPQVWEQLPESRDFVTALKQKGGWSADYWSPAMVAERFAVLHIPAAAAAQCK